MLGAEQIRTLDALADKAAQAVRDSDPEEVALSLHKMEPLVPSEVLDRWPHTIDLVLATMQAIARAGRLRSEGKPYLASLDVAMAKRLLRSRHGVLLLGAGKRRRDVMNPLDDELRRQLTELESSIRKQRQAVE
jgi:hypothetical protein